MRRSHDTRAAVRAGSLPHANRIGSPATEDDAPRFFVEEFFEADFFEADCFAADFFVADFFEVDFLEPDVFRVDEEGVAEAGDWSEGRAVGRRS